MNEFNKALAEVYKEFAQTNARFGGLISAMDALMKILVEKGIVSKEELKTTINKTLEEPTGLTNNRM